MSAKQARARKCIYCGTPTAARKTVVYRLMATDTTHSVPVCPAPACEKLHGEVMEARERQAREDREG